MKLDPGSRQSWQSSSQHVEGYLLSGTTMETECVGGEIMTAEYLPGGYFHRPPGAIHGGPEATTTSGAVWFLRVPGHEQIDVVDECIVTAGQTE